MNLDGWDWLADLKKIANKEEKKENEKKDPEEEKIAPNYKYVAGIIAGRPVFSHPSEMGGHRIRYGRARNTGLAAGGLHPATMAILDDFVAIGTQLRIERPGKSSCICPVSSIEPPIVKLKGGDVIRVKSPRIAKEIKPKIEQILFLGDILFGFGEFAENNHKLVPSGYVEEWWALELEKAVQNREEDVEKFYINPFENIPTAEEVVRISKKYNIPLHPRYLNFWGNITVGELLSLRECLIKGFDESKERIILENEENIKNILEKAFILHKVKNGKILLSKKMTQVYETIFDLHNKNTFKKSETDTVFTYFDKISPIKIKNKAPYYMGTRMGRPEKSERKSMKGIHALFPLSDKVGNSRLVEKAMEIEIEGKKEEKEKNRDVNISVAEKKKFRINIDVCRRECPTCGSTTIFNLCPKCKVHTELRSICEICKKRFPAIDPKEEKNCPQCGEKLKSSSEATFNIKSYVKSTLMSLQVPLPKKLKGIIGLTNQFKIPEPIEKGILRAKNDVLVYKTAEIRYDATDIPLTHFKPKEIGITIERLKELGYMNDYKGNPIQNDDQIFELKVQDLLLSYDCADYMQKVANFIDDELEIFYKMERFYNIKNRQGLIGHLVVGLAPHTSAGIIGRIIGFSPARSIYAHPFWHAAKRRNCDGDEDGIMLLLDPLLNFSRNYLPSKIGGRMDATLVISTKLDPNEIDVEAHNIDTSSKYPLEFYEATEHYTSPNEIESIMNLVKSRLGTSDQYENLGFNIPTEDINDGPLMTSYKTYESMDDKLNAQLQLAKIIKAVDAKKVASQILITHFNPDILGNLRKFATQEFRCVKCNTKFRRPPLSKEGKCPLCGNNIILTVNKGGIEKYIPRALMLCKEFNLDNYTVQRMEIVKEYVESLTNNPKIRQQKLSDFF